MLEPSIYTLFSDNYRAVISSLGAELKSLVNLHTGEEYIWSGDPSIWKGTAPVLFPIVGRLKQGLYQYQGKTYQLDKHGFARNSLFKLITDKNGEKSFLIQSTTETLKNYPFEFEFEVFFRMTNQGLEVRYVVRNRGNDTMYFTLGSHPAFSLPLVNNRLDDYYLEFDSKEQLDCYFLENDLLCTQPIRAYLNNKKILPITAELFANDALIFKNIKSRNIAVINNKVGKRLSLNMGEAPHLGIWAKAGAPYICLEPWFSFDDSVDADGLLVNKPGIISLSENECFTTSYRVEL